MKTKELLKNRWRVISFVLLALTPLVLFAVPATADVIHIQPIANGTSLWEVDGTETQLITADDLDIQNQSILNVLNIDGVDVGILDSIVSTHTTQIAYLSGNISAIWGDIGDLQTDLGIAQGDISDLEIDMGIAQGDISDAQGNITGLKSIAIIYVMDGGGSAITTGQKGHLDIPFDCTITSWVLLADQSGDIVIDVWKDTYGNFPPTVADTIAGSEKPTLSSAQNNQDLDLGTWTTSITGGDILAFNVESCTSITRITLTITAVRVV